MTATVYSTETENEREAAIEAAAQAVANGRTIVIPTDTVYGIAADAFSRGGVQQLLSAKGRSRRMPPPVLIAHPGVLSGLADDVSAEAHALAEAFWPGALTLIVYSQPSLTWDLGETHGTVALRVPHDDLARDILQRTGPLAVSSANRTGQTAATSAEEAVEQLGERVEAIIDGGLRPLGRDASVPSIDVEPSTIIDVTGHVPVLVRRGALSLAELKRVAPTLITAEELYEQQQQDEGPARSEWKSDPVENPEVLSMPTAAATAADVVGQGVVGADTAGSAASRPVVDQLRHAPRRQPEVASEPAGNAIRPLPVDAARALVLGQQGQGQQDDAVQKESAEPSASSTEDVETEISVPTEANEQAASDN